MSAFAAPGLYNGVTHAGAVEESLHTASIGADVVSSPEGSASSESAEDGQAIASTVQATHHVTKRRSAPALIQGGPSPAKSAVSDATLVNSPPRASPLKSRTPVHANVDHVVVISSSSQQDLSSTVWGTPSKVDEKVSRYHGSVEQLQAELATERETAQHDRGVARQALGEAQDDIADLEAEISDLKDELESEKQTSQNHLDDYDRRDRDATAVITDCLERVAKLEADLNLEQRKARHNYSKAEEFMHLAESWRNSFHQLGHDPEALWKMLVEELRVRGIVFDYYGHLHRVGLRKVLLGAEGVDEWVPGLGDRSLLAQEANEGEVHEITMDAMTETGDAVIGGEPERNAPIKTNMGQGQMSAKVKTVGEQQVEAKPKEEYVVEKEGHFVDANRINEQTQKCTDSESCGPEPLIEVPTGEAVSNDQRHGVYQGSDTAGLLVGNQDDLKVLMVEDEANIEHVASNSDLAGISNANESPDSVSQQDETDSTDSDRYETVSRMSSFKDCKVGAVSWRSEPNNAAWEIPFRLPNPQTSSLGFKHALRLPTMGNGLLGSLHWSHRKTYEKWTASMMQRGLVSN